MNGKEREDGTKSISQEAVCCSGTGARQRAIGVDEVQHTRAEDEEIADAEGDRAEDRDDPMDVGSGRPGEPEKTDREQARTQHCGVQPFLRQQGCEITLSLSLERLLAVDHAVHRDGDESAEDDADADAEEHKPALAGVEMVDLDFRVRGAEDDGEGGEEAEQHAEVEGRVDGEEGDDGFREEHSQRPRDRHHDDEVHLGHFGRHE